MLFSVAMLAAIYMAIPAGLLMREPMSATISTIVGAIAFTIYVAYTFSKDHIKSARRVIYQIIAALPDTTRYAYIGLTGTHCRISNINIAEEYNRPICFLMFNIICHLFTVKNLK